jgi:hypothetical protein
MSTSAEDIVEAFAADVAHAVGQAAPGIPGLWGAQIGVVFPDAGGPWGAERIWVFPVARDDADLHLDEEGPARALAQLDEAVCPLVVALFADVTGLAGAVPTGLRAQVDAADGAADVDFSYGALDVAPLDSDDVGDWVGELFDD